MNFKKAGESTKKKAKVSYSLSSQFDRRIERFRTGAVDKGRRRASMIQEELNKGGGG